MFNIFIKTKICYLLLIFLFQFDANRIKRRVNCPVAHF